MSLRDEIENLAERLDPAVRKPMARLVTRSSKTEGYQSDEPGAIHVTLNLSERGSLAEDFNDEPGDELADLAKGDRACL